MTRPALHVVADATRRSPATLGARLKQLQAELDAANAEQIGEFRSALLLLSEVSAAVALNAHQPPGIRDLARRLVEDCEVRLGSVDGILARAGQ